MKMIKQPSYEELLKEGTALLTGAGVPDADIDAWLLLSHAVSFSRAAYYMRCREEAGCRETAVYREYLQRRARRIPLQHITGSTEFMGLTFCVSPAALIPRPDTETLAEAVLRFNAGCGRRQSLLDLGTGTGCLAVSLSRLGCFSAVTAVDISGEALRLARENGRLHKTDIDWRQGDLFSALEPEERYDIQVSNPPYIPRSEIAGLMPEVRDHDPLTALDGGADGLDFYRRLAAEGPEHLTAGGRVFYEIGFDQAAAVVSVLSDAGFGELSVIRDISGNDRVVTGEYHV